MVTTKKIQLFPVGEKEERDRVYRYLRDGIYHQYQILNTYMSQVGCLYYKYDKDFKAEGFKEEYKEMFHNTNTAIYDFEQAKGLGMAGNCARRVQQDFSAALKNGLAKGERSLTFYKRDFPLIVPGRFLTLYTGEDRYIDDEGNQKEAKAFFIKFVNGIHFKVYLGTAGKKRPDFYLPSLLRSIVEDPEHYHICGSSIQITNKGKIMLNLCVRIDKSAAEYKPVAGRTMGLSMGYDKCLVAALSDDDEMYEIADNLKESIIEKRIAIQEHNQLLQKTLRYNAKGGHGRKRKLSKLEKHKAYEKNVMRNFNHMLSKKVVDFAKDHKVESIVIENIEKKDLEDYPLLLRNWSYYQLLTYITYKAEREGIVVVTEDKLKRKKKKAEDSEENVIPGLPKTICYNCGAEAKDALPKEFEWCNAISFTCPKCNRTIDYSYNKAKNMIGGK